MAKVKGSKQERMIVVPYRPWRLIWVRTGLCVLIILVASGTYFFGYRQAVDENGDARAERDALRNEVVLLQAGKSALDQQILNLEQAGNVDKEALNSVQQTILSLREKISQLEEDVLFYKQVLSPESSSPSFMFNSIDHSALSTKSLLRR